MANILAVIVLRVLAGCAVAALFWYLLGAFGLAMSAPLFGALLARPLIELLAEFRASTRALAYADVKGQYFEHRGMRLRVVEDERHHRWVSLNGVRRIMPGLPRDEVLRRSKENRSLLGKRMELIRREIAGLRNPMASRRSVYAAGGSGGIVDISG